MELCQPNTTLELLSYKNVVGSMSMKGWLPVARLTKLLLNVMIQGSLGLVQVVMSPKLTIDDLAIATMKIYAKSVTNH